MVPDSHTPDGIIPDHKNWTWVLDHPCPECGFDASKHSAARLGAEIRTNAATWRELLADPRVTERPNPAQWSALEYGCHVRDVFELFLVRLNLMLTEDSPIFANWDQDETALTERYAEQDPERVSYALAAAAGRLADQFDRVEGPALQRTGRRTDGATFTVESFGLYLLHDPIHHVWDVRRGYAELSIETA